MYTHTLTSHNCNYICQLLDSRGAVFCDLCTTRCAPVIFKITDIGHHMRLLTSVPQDCFQEKLGKLLKRLYCDLRGNAEICKPVQHACMAARNRAKTYAQAAGSVPGQTKQSLAIL